MSRLKKIRNEVEDLVTKTVASSGKPRREVLSDVSDVIEDSLRKHEGIEFTGKNWGLVMKLVVLDDMLVSDNNLVD
jgi:ribosomal protein L17